METAATAREFFSVRAPLPAVRDALRKSRFDLEGQGALQTGFILNLRRREPPASPLLVDGRTVPVVPFPQGTMSLVNLIVGKAAGGKPEAGQAIFYVRRNTFDRLADDLGTIRLVELPLEAGAAADDPVMTQLGACLLPAIERPGQVDEYVVDQIAGAVNTHLASRFGAMKCPPRPSKGGLAPWQLRLAQRMLGEQLDSSSVLAQVAVECRLSTSHFTRAFRRSTGTPPHQWLTRCRVERATEMLRATGLTLSEIALACGFFDQSHFSRVFSQSTGMAPGQWRRLHRAPQHREKDLLLEAC